MDSRNWMNLTGHENTRYTHIITRQYRFAADLLSFKSRAPINRDISRYIKQIAVTESRGREKQAHRVKVSGGPKRKDTRERHAWRSRTTCNHYHKYIKSDPASVPPPARPGSRRDRSISAPSRRKTNDRRFSLRAPWTVCCTDRIRYVPRSRGDSRVRKVTRTPTGAYNVRALSRAICKRQQVSLELWRAEALLFKSQPLHINILPWTCTSTLAMDSVYIWEISRVLWK